MTTCPNCQLMRQGIALEIEKSSDPMTVANLQHLLSAVTPDPTERGEVPLFTEA